MFNWLVDSFLGALQGGVIAAAALERIGDGVEGPADHERDTARVVVDLGAIMHGHILCLVAGACCAVEHVIVVSTQHKPAAAKGRHQAQVQPENRIVPGVTRRPRGGIQHTATQRQILQ